MKCELVKWIMRCIENGLNCWSHSVVSMKSSWRHVTSGAFYESIPEPRLFNLFVNGLDDGTESKFVNNTKLGRLVDISNGCAALQRDLNTPEKRANRNLMRLSEGKCKVLQLGRSNPRHQHMLRANKLEDSSAEEDPRILVDNNMGMNQQCTLAAKVISILGCIRNSVTSKTMGGDPSLFGTGLTMPVVLCPVPDSPVQDRHENTGEKTKRLLDD